MVTVIRNLISDCCHKLWNFCRFPREVLSYHRISWVMVRWYLPAALPRGNHPASVDSRDITLFHLTFDTGRDDQTTFKRSTMRWKLLGSQHGCFLLSSRLCLPVLSPTHGGHISNSHISSGHVSSGYISSSSHVDSSDISNGHVNSGYVSKGNVNGGYVRNGNVNSGYISKGNVNGGYVRNGIVNGGYISSSHVNSGYVSNGNVNSGYVSNGNVNGGYVSSGNVNGGYVSSSHISSSHISSGSINPIHSMVHSNSVSHICFSLASGVHKDWRPLSIQVPLTSCKTWTRNFSKSTVDKVQVGLSRKAGMIAPVFLSAEKHLGRTAILDRFGRFTFDDILHHSCCLSKELTEMCGHQSGTLEHARIGFLCENDVSYVVTLFAIWMAKGVAVPLCKTHPVSELEYFVQDSACSALVASQCFADRLCPVAEQFNLPLRVVDDSELTNGYHINECFVSEKATASKNFGKAKKTRPKRWYDLHQFNNGFKNDPAQIIYTSGTTGRPKGVVQTHGNLSAMISNMVWSWAWSAGDVILHVLPLHHVHGAINALLTPLHVGATCFMLPKFDPQEVWHCLVNPLSHTDGVRVNLFMAVPTIYAKLIEHHDLQLHKSRGSRLASEYIKSVCMSRIRLMVSGSAALPQPVMEKWENITGHRLLERYGMTEIGMALTNPLSGPRIAGTVGRPFQSVDVCIAKPNVYAKNGYDVIAVGNAQRTTVEPGQAGESGELLVKGPSVFHHYWNRPQATAEAFTPDGWFKTGDTVTVDSQGVYKIIGRTSVDVIKSGGYKISALEIERHLLAHEAISDCAVVGLPDITWGQRVAAVVVLNSEQNLTLDDLKSWARNVLPPYQIPSVLRCLPVMPRNAMGKVNKKNLVEEVFPEYLKEH